MLNDPASQHDSQHSDSRASGDGAMRFVSGSLDERLVLALEACRPGSHDLEDPAMAPLASKLASDPGVADLHDRLQCLDARITMAFHDLPVAGDLAGRVVACLALDRPRPRWARRGLLIGGALSAVAAGWLMAVWLAPHSPKPFSEQYVLDEGIRLFDATLPESPAWSKDGPTTSEYPLSDALVEAVAVRWQPVQGFSGSQGLVYELSESRESRAVLFVVRCGVEGAASAPGWQPFTTAGFSASAWQENGLLYVLVVRGDPSAYRRFLRLPSGPIA
jgi:hypothetical protein